MTKTYKSFHPETNITIDNVLEENKVDVEIEGNTLVNLVSEIDYKGTNIYDKTFTKSENSYILESPTGSSVFTINSSYNLKGKTVTLCFNHGVAPLHLTHVGYFNGSVYEKIEDYEYDVVEGHNKAKLVIPEDYQYLYLGYTQIKSESSTQKISDIMLLEGDWTNKEVPKYFEGMKSVGELEDNKLEIKSQNKNLWDGTYEVGTIATDDTVVPGGTNLDYGQNRKRSFYIPLKSSRVYTISQKDYVNQGGYQIYIHQYDEYKNPILWENRLHYKAITNELTFILSDSAKYIRFRTDDNRELEKDSIMIEANSTPSNIVSSLVNKKEIILNQPLKGLPNGAKDRIIKRNGQWVVERKVGKIVLNGSEKWTTFADNSDLFLAYVDVENSPALSVDIVSNKLKTSRIISSSYNDGECISSRNVSNGFILAINKSRFDITNGSKTGFVEWLKNNNIEVIYRLEESIYEPLNIDPSINLYLDTTHISNNSNIPANMKVTVDRTINRAIEAIELMKINPTLANIERARMWTNLLKESTKKMLYTIK